MQAQKIILGLHNYAVRIHAWWIQWSNNTRRT